MPYISNEEIEKYVALEVYSKLPIKFEDIVKRSKIMKKALTDTLIELNEKQLNSLIDKIRENTERGEQSKLNYDDYGTIKEIISATEKREKVILNKAIKKIEKIQPPRGMGKYEKFKWWKKNRGSDSFEYNDGYDNAVWNVMGILEHMKDKT